MSYFVYCAVVLFATTLGALAGIGGGVIIKPVFDAFGEYTVGEISVMSSCAVFAMSLLSILMGAKRIRQNKNENKAVLSIAIGSAAGGCLGEYIFSLVTKADSSVKIIQNIILLVFIVFVIVYMRKEDRKSIGCKSPVIGIITGLFLGAIAAFLGIGGGPINIAVISLVFGFEIKTAVVCSLMSILFSQSAKLISVAIRDISSFNIKLLPFIVLTGLCGALIGRTLNRKASNKTVNRCFIAVQILILLLCIFNIIKYII